MKTSQHSDRAVCWCLVGAIDREENAGDISSHAMELAEKMLRATIRKITKMDLSPISFNDRWKTKHQDVINLIDITINNAGDYREEDED